jgi:hypothetical protein
MTHWNGIAIHDGPPSHLFIGEAMAYLHSAVVTVKPTHTVFTVGQYEYHIYIYKDKAYTRSKHGALIVHPMFETLWRLYEGVQARLHHADNEPLLLANGSELPTIKRRYAACRSQLAVRDQP